MSLYRSTRCLQTAVCRAMAAHTRVAVGYNVQVAVDVKHKLIVEQQVTNQVVDMGLLTQTAEPAKDERLRRNERQVLGSAYTGAARPVSASASHSGA